MSTEKTIEVNTGSLESEQIFIFLFVIARTSWGRGEARRITPRPVRPAPRQGSQKLGDVRDPDDDGGVPPLRDVETSRRVVGLTDHSLLRKSVDGRPQSPETRSVDPVDSTPLCKWVHVSPSCPGRVRADVSLDNSCKEEENRDRGRGVFSGPGKTHGPWPMLRSYVWDFRGPEKSEQWFSGPQLDVKHILESKGVDFLLRLLSSGRMKSPKNASDLLSYLHFTIL